MRSEVTWTQTCASLNHRKKMKAEPSRLIPRKPTGNLARAFKCEHKRPAQSRGLDHQGKATTTNRDCLPCSLFISTSRRIQPFNVNFSKDYMPCSLYWYQVSLRTVARKSSIGDFYVCAGGLDILKNLTKLWGAKPTKTPVATGLVAVFLIGYMNFLAVAITVLYSSASYVGGQLEHVAPSHDRHMTSGDSKWGLGGPWPPQIFAWPPVVFLNFPFKFIWFTYTVDNLRPAIF